MIRRPPRSTLFPTRRSSDLTEVRDKTRGEIAVVTLADIGDRPASDVALQIGRQWGVGPKGAAGDQVKNRSEEHTSELQSQSNLVCRLLLEKKKNILYT